LRAHPTPGAPPPSPGPVVQGRATTWQMYSTQVSTQGGGGVRVGGVGTALGIVRPLRRDPDRADGGGVALDGL
jgi:hypothetical protein